MTRTRTKPTTASASWLRSSSKDTDTTIAIATIPETNGKDQDENENENENDDATKATSENLNLLQTENFGRNGYSMTSGYSRFLYTQEEKPTWWGSKRKKRKQLQAMDEMNEDGYGDMQRRERNRSIFQKVLRLPFRTAKKILQQDTKEPGTLILVRHGESEWNKNKTFTGWADPGESTQQNTY